MRRTLVLIGLLLALFVLFWPFLLRLGIGRLPGDFVIQNGGSTLYFPLTSMILLSLLLTVVLWILRR